jgi:hypothetical protein
MWVKVSRREGPYYVGTLMNQPVCSDEQRALRYRARVVFMPENVIDIKTAAEVRAEEEADKRRRRRRTKARRVARKRRA